jgi:hypothetical protein
VRERYPDSAKADEGTLQGAVYFSLYVKMLIALPYFLVIQKFR